MSNSLPTPGGSSNIWASQLNTWLEVAHNTDGTLQAVSPYADQQPGNEHGLTSPADPAGFWSSRISSSCPPFYPARPEADSLPSGPSLLLPYAGRPEQ